jgi:hypothetical protein
MKIKLLSLALILLCINISPSLVIENEDSNENSPQQLYSSITAYRIAYSSSIQDLKLIRDASSFEFKSGRIDIIEPVRGRYHAAVFEGEGLFILSPPTQIERDQLKKFIESEKLEEEFENAVFRFTDDTGEDLMAALGIESLPDAPEQQESKECRESKTRIMKQHLRNIDSRVLCDIVSGEKDYFFAEIASRNRGKFIFEIDPHSREEVSLVQFKKNPWEFIDTWCSFHLADQYESERPVRDRPNEVIEIPHFEVDLTLEKDGMIKATAILDCVALEKSVTAIPFTISRLVDVDEVTDDQGSSCFFVHEQARDKMGEPPLKQQNLVVCLPVPFPKGEKRKLVINYHSDELIEKVENRKEYHILDTISWYPRYGSLRRSTSKVTYRIPPSLHLISVGKKTKEWEEGGMKCSIWEQDIPVAAVCFNFGDLRHYRISAEKLPPVDVYAGGFLIDKIRMHNTGTDVINSLNYFQKVLTPYPFPSIIATETPGSGGQGLPGFLLLSHYSFRDDDYPGINEAFRGHEVSHQWWGHIVGWETYHDQWLSEGFAEYFGALYAQVVLAGKKKKLLQNMVENWKNDILKRGNRAFIMYGWPKLDKRLTLGSKSGPIWLGYRLSSSKSPLDYYILVYEKGAYILHMLRMMMMDYKNNSSENFFVMIRDFIKTYSWKNATTEGFRSIVEKHMRADMKWFFDQWVYGTDIPTYKFKWHTEPGKEGKVDLVMEVEQSGVPDGFKMPVPFLIDFGKKRYAVIRRLVDSPSNTFKVFGLPDKPKKVEFNFNGSALCHEK